MPRPRFLHRLTYLVGILAALLVIVCNSGEAAAQTIRTPTKFQPDSAYGVRPLWKYARRLTSTRGVIPTCLTSAVPPRCFSPEQIRRAYGVQPLIDAGITGKGRTIILIDGSTSSTLQTDVHTYDQLYGLKDPKINVISPFGPPPYDPGAYIETALDIEIAHAIAPDATIDLILAQTTFAFRPADFVSILLGATRYAVDNNLGDVISQSFGVGESCVGSGYLQAEQAVFSKARAKGITVLASSGDSGAATEVCQGFNITIGKGVSVPSSDPLVTAVGGTTLDASVKRGDYIGEVTWNENNVGAGATGGGISNVFPVPSYQQSIGLKLPGRGVPDVAFDGDPFTGVPIVVSIQGTTLIAPVGGTSVGSPAWAGIVALADQAAGKRLGFLNPAFYKISTSASYAQGFHDITFGNNSVTGFDRNGNPVPIPGYDAGPGWDAVTGVGSPDVAGLVPLLVKAA